MSNYIKQNFSSGQILKTDHLNHIEDGIETVSVEKITMPKSGEVIDHGFTGQFAVSDGKGGIIWKTLVEAEAVRY